MEHLALWIYLFGVVDDIKNMEFFGLNFITGFSCLIWVIIFGVSFFPESEFPNGTFHLLLKLRKSVGRFCIFLISLSVLIGVLQTLLPSSKTIAAMIIIPKIAENKDIQQLPTNVAKMLNNAVEAWSKDLLPAKEKK